MSSHQLQPQHKILLLAMVIGATPTKDVKSKLLSVAFEYPSMDWCSLLVGLLQIELWPKKMIDMWFEHSQMTNKFVRDLQNPDCSTCHR